MKQTAGLKKLPLKVEKIITPTRQCTNNAYTIMIFVLGRDQKQARGNKYLFSEVLHKLQLLEPSIRNMLLVESGCILQLQIPVDCFLRCYFDSSFRERPIVCNRN